MTLDQYLTSEGVTAADFGQRLQMSEASVSRIRRGAQNITRDVMLNIIAASDGKITPDGLVSPHRESLVLRIERTSQAEAA